MPEGKPLHVLVVGQTPPPFGGQAVMVQALLDSTPAKAVYHHVRLTYSDDMDSVGKFALKKVLVLFTTIVEVWIARFKYRTPMLYYPPSGPNMVPVLRDIVFLCAVRPFFRWTVFHYHAGGVSGFALQLPALLRPFFRLAYRNATLAIRTAPQNPEDGKLLGAKMDIVVPNGTPDMRGTVVERTAALGEPVIILFTGVLIPSKGVRVLLEAFRQVVAAGGHARLQLMGRWGDPVFQAECERFLDQYDLRDKVEFLGVKRDPEKLEFFAGCDLFCFPSHFEAESFGLVLIEAMQFAKPVVTTAWRGIPSVAHDGVNGYVVPVEDPAAVADRILRLLKDPELRVRMGNEGRRIFAERFTLGRFQRSMEDAFLAASANP
ncbi:MAG: glycosyltransferase family 4 protein [Flavobacteriales bacterium]